MQYLNTAATILEFFLIGYLAYGFGLAFLKAAGVVSPYKSTTREDTIPVKEGINAPLADSKPSSPVEEVEDPWELPATAAIIASPINPKPVLKLLPPAKPSNGINYNTLTIRQLKQLARDRRVRGYGKMTKHQLVKMLTAA